MTLAAVMLGSAAVSAGCCVAPRAQASMPARILSGAMVAVMAAATLGAAPVVQGTGALLLLVLAGAFVRGSSAEQGRQVNWHRAVGAVLMALAVLIPEHSASMTAGPMSVESGMGHGTAAAHGTMLVLLLRAATAAYLCWLAAAVVQLRDRPITDLLRWEQLAMGASLAVMVFFMG